MSRGPWTATPKSKISRTRNNYLSKKQEHLLISETMSWNGLFSSSRYSTSDLNWQFIFDLLQQFKLFLQIAIRFQTQSDNSFSTYCCFLFDFKLLNVVDLIQSKGPWSDTPWARPGEFWISRTTSILKSPKPSTCRDAFQEVQNTR